MPPLRPIIFAILLHSLSDIVIGQMISIDPMGSDADLEVVYKERIDRCKGKESIDLSESGLKSINKNFIDSRLITSVSLEGNLIEEIPRDAFSQIPMLKCLNIGQNRIPLNRLITFQHDNLKTLIVSHQHYVDRCGNEETFDTERYKSDDLIPIVDSSIAAFPNLEHLDLSGTVFHDFPKYFNLTFPRLTHLYLTDRNIVDIWPEFIFKLPYTLESLHFENNFILEIQFPYLANVKALFLDGNPLNASNINIASGRLEVLSLSNCSLPYVSPSLLRQVPNLVSLDLSFNRIFELQMGALDTRIFLKKLSLSHNRFREFPYFGDMVQLSSLSLSYNYIDSIPSTIFPSSLKTLSLRGNRISNVAGTAFENLQSLQELDLAENMLTSLPQSWMIQLTNLRYLNLKYNQFVSIADMRISLESSLDHLFIKNNFTTTFDASSLQYIPQKCTLHVL